MTTPHDDEIARLRQELSAAIRARETLLAGVAHDLRNPLNTFAMSTGLLKDDLEREDLDAKRALSLVARMERAVARMQSLIDDLVEASRIDAGQFELARRDESLDAIVGDAASAAKPLLREKGVTLAIAPIDPSIRCSVDRHRIVQALAKATVFALKAVGEGGRLALDARRDSDAVVFEIVGTMPGAPASAPSADEGRGGLALLIARGVVGAHGGRLRVDQTDGIRVTITLPTT